MPYIKSERREFLDPYIESLIACLDLGTIVDGEVNYILTRIVDSIYGHGGYAVMSRAIGVLDCVKEEFRRRRLNPYEDQKIIENGDVYL